MSSSYRKLVNALTGANKDQSEPKQTDMKNTGLAFGTVESYTLVPANLRREYLENSTPYWRIELHDMAHTGPEGYDLVGAAVVGRGKEADLNIDVGYLEGLSRQHILLRPAADTLYLIDLNSKNGTYVNDKPIMPGSEKQLKDGDKVTLGNMSFTIKLIDHSTLGELRDLILKLSLQDKSSAGKQDATSDKSETNGAGKSAPDTIVMHFRKTMRYPESISRWMTERREGQVAK